MKELKVQINWPFQLESSFTTHWLKKLKEKWYYVDKVSDGWIWMKKVDSYIRTDKDSYCCEIKLIDKDIFPLNRLRHNQWASLRKWHELWWTAIVVVYSKTLNKYTIIPFDIIKDLDKNDSIKLSFKK